MNRTWTKPIGCALLCGLAMGCSSSSSGRSIAEATERLEFLALESVEIEERLFAEGGIIDLQDLPSGRATYNGPALVFSGSGDFLADSDEEDVQIENLLLGEMTVAVNFDATTLSGTADDFVALADTRRFDETNSEEPNLTSSGDVAGQLTLQADAFGGDFFSGPLTVKGTLRPPNGERLTLDASGGVDFGGVDAGFITVVAVGINEVNGVNASFDGFSGIAER